MGCIEDDIIKIQEVELLQKRQHFPYCDDVNFQFLYLDNLVFNGGAHVAQSLTKNLGGRDVGIIMLLSFPFKFSCQTRGDDALNFHSYLVFKCCPLFHLFKNSTFHKCIPKGSVLLKF